MAESLGPPSAPPPPGDDAVPPTGEADQPTTVAADRWFIDDVSETHVTIAAAAARDIGPITELALMHVPKGRRELRIARDLLMRLESADVDLAWTEEVVHVLPRGPVESLLVGEARRLGTQDRRHVRDGDVYWVGAPGYEPEGRGIYPRLSDPPTIDAYFAQAPYLSPESAWAQLLDPIYSLIYPIWDATAAARQAIKWRVDRAVRQGSGPVRRG